MKRWPICSELIDSFKEPVIAIALQNLFWFEKKKVDGTCLGKNSSILLDLAFYANLRKTPSLFYILTRFNLSSVTTKSGCKSISSRICSLKTFVLNGPWIDNLISLSWGMILERMFLSYSEKVRRLTFKQGILNYFSK